MLSSEGMYVGVRVRKQLVPQQSPHSSLCISWSCCHLLRGLLLLLRQDPFRNEAMTHLSLPRS